MSTVPAQASIDFETFSTVDLTKSGSSRYARDPDTGVICLAFAIDGADPQVWDCNSGAPIPTALRDHIIFGGTLCAWNVGFERFIWQHVMVARHGWPPVPDAQWSCTMARGLYWGLPAGLDGAAKALNLPVAKDKAGHTLMLTMCKPYGVNAAGQPVYYHQTDPDKLQRLCAYCAQDVVVEQMVSSTIPQLPKRELAVWRLDQKMNERGIGVDLPLVTTMHGIALNARVDLGARLNAASGGFLNSITKAGAMKAWLNAQFLPISDLKRDTVATWRRVVEPGPVRDVLDIRAEASRTSVAKLDALMRATDTDGRLRNTLRYYGAGRTGRWSGAGGTRAQLQNLPRPTIKDVDAALSLIEQGANEDDLAMLFEDSPLGVLASCLRGCFNAGPGQVLVTSDLSQIEARVIAWLAGQDDVLEVFRQNEDIYTYTAESIGSTDRQLGKVIRLALGFGMGHVRFAATALTFGVMLTAEDAVQIVDAWRGVSTATMRLWWRLDDTFRRVIKMPPCGKVQATKHISFEKGRNGGIAMHLPSGRFLVYRNARLEIDPKTDREAITYDGVHQKSHQWKPIRTYGGKLAENATQAIARDVMVDAMLALDGAGHVLLLTAHDEIIASAPPTEAPAVLDTMLAVTRTPPTWADDLPVWSEGYIADRYRK
jgi:DNA polymerase